MPGPINVYFHLFFGDFEHGGNGFITLSFEIAELHATPLLLRKAVYDLFHHLDSIPMNDVLVGIIGAVRCVFPVERVAVVAQLLDAVKGYVAANGEAESLNRLDFVPRISLVPDFYQCFLHDVFGFCAVKRDAQRKSVTLILQREYRVFEADIFPLRSIGLTNGR